MPAPQTPSRPRQTASLTWLLIPIAAIVLAYFGLRWIWHNLPENGQTFGYVWAALVSLNPVDRLTACIALAALLQNHRIKKGN